MKKYFKKGEDVMKKNFNSRRWGGLKTLAGGFALLAIVTFILPNFAHAALPANTQITNSATLSYYDGAATQTATSSVTVTVALVPAAAAVVAGSDQSTPYTGTNTELNNTFSVTATSNGPDQYTLTPAIVGTPTNTTGASISLTSPTSPVTLGATITLSGSTTTILKVPSDGTADAVVNEIAVGDTVVVSGEARTVSAVSDPGGNGTATITLASALSSAPAAGVTVAERVTVTVNVKSGTIVTNGTSIVVVKNLTVASVTDNTKTTTSNNVTDTYTSGLATFTKYVRNVTHPVAGTTSLEYPASSGNVYYRTGVKAVTGDVLEYLLVVENSGSGSISQTYVTDSLPVTYADFNTTPYSGSTAVTYYNESGTASYYTAASGDDPATWSSPTLTVYVGTGATSSAGGTIAAGANVHVLYQVTVK